MSQDSTAEGDLNGLVASWLNYSFTGLKCETGTQGRGWPYQPEEGINSSFVRKDGLEQGRGEDANNLNSQRSNSFTFLLKLVLLSPTSILLLPSSQMSRLHNPGLGMWEVGFYEPKVDESVGL